MDTADWLREALQWSGCRIALRVDREVRAADGGLLAHDTRYFLASCVPERVTAAELLQHVRGHWGIENKVHFLKDRWWDEDRHATRRPGLAACLATLNNAAVTIHRLRSAPDLPVRAAADHIAWRPELGLQLLHKK